MIKIDEDRNELKVDVRNFSIEFKSAHLLLFYQDKNLTVTLRQLPGNPKILKNKLLAKLNGLQGENIDLYIRFGTPEDLKQKLYDTVSYGIIADELITIDDPTAGTYYILVHSHKDSGSYTLVVV